MTRLSLWTTLAAIAGLSACGPRDNSCLYVGKGAGSLSLIQIIQNKDGHITGRSEERHVNNDGTVADYVLVIDGTSSAGDMTLVFHPTWMPAGYSATAQTIGDTLTVASRGQTSTLGRTTLQQYQTEVAALSKQAALTADKYRKAVEANAAEATQRQHAIEQQNIVEAALVSARQAEQADIARSTARVQELAAVLTNLEGGIRRWQQVEADIKFTAETMPRQTAELRSLLQSVPNYKSLGGSGNNPVEKMRAIFEANAKKYTDAKSLAKSLPERKKRWDIAFSNSEAACAQVSLTKARVEQSGREICDLIKSKSIELKNIGFSLTAALESYITMAKVEGTVEYELVQAASRTCSRYENC
jgi:hypothetical protein